MPIEITMPQLSDTMSEGTLVKWHKAEGDVVKAGEELADVETDKAVMPMEAFEGGTLAVVLVKEGEQRVELDLRYVGFRIPAAFVVGYGLDVAERYRNLSGIHLYVGSEGEGQ